MKTKAGQKLTAKTHELARSIRATDSTLTYHAAMKQAMQQLNAETKQAKVKQKIDLSNLLMLLVMTSLITGFFLLFFSLLTYNLQMTIEHESNHAHLQQSRYTKAQLINFTQHKITLEQFEQAINLSKKLGV